MKWRRYTDIIDKLCAWSVYQRLYQELDNQGLLSDSDVRRVMQYMQQLCVSSNTCDTRSVCQDIWKRDSGKRGMASCLNYLESALDQNTFDTLEQIIETHIKKPCLDNPTLAEFNVIDEYKNNWKVLRKELQNGGNQLMFFSKR